MVMGADEIRMYAGFLRDKLEEARREREGLEEMMSQEVQDVFFKNFWKGRSKSPPDADKKKPFSFDKSVLGTQAAHPKAKPRKKWVSAGGVVFDSLKTMNKVWIIKPSNNYGPWAFPKGKVDEGESMKKTAVREVMEETGIMAQILPGGYLGKGVGSFSITHFWAMIQTGGSAGQHDKEVEKVQLVSFTDAFKKFKRAGNKRDIGILRKAWEYTNKLRKGKVKGAEKLEKPPWYQ
jgi:8-oxo-dGTP pyrophosphatase MutT (NUDIX family)